MIRITFRKTIDSKITSKYPDYIDFDGSFPGLGYDLPLEALDPSWFSTVTGIRPHTVAKMIRSGELPSIVWAGKPFVVSYKSKIVFGAPDDLPMHYEDLGAWIQARINNEHA